MRSRVRNQMVRLRDVYGISGVVLKRENRQYLHDKKQTAKEIVKEKRKLINQHLDTIENQILSDIDECYEKEHFKNETELDSLYKEFEKIQEIFIDIKQNESSIKLFLTARRIKVVAEEKVRVLKDTMKSVSQFDIEIDMHSTIEAFLNEVKKFGDVTFTRKDCDIYNKRPRLKKKFDIADGSEIYPVSDFFMFRDSRLFIVDQYGSGNLSEYTTDGVFVRHIKLSGRPHGITMLDNDRIAISFYDYVEIIDVNLNKVEKTIEVKRDCLGISCYENRLYVGLRGMKGVIVVIDLIDNATDTIKIDGESAYYLAISNDKIYYSDPFANAIYCCSLIGENIWTFINESIRKPIGLSLDSQENVFVVGLDSNNLSIIKHDGTETTHDGLDRPAALFFNKDAKLLCLGYKSKGVALYYI